MAGLNYKKNYSEVKKMVDKNFDRCNIKGCKNNGTYNYGWEQGKLEAEILLCKYCHFQLLGEMLKQMAIERMCDGEELEKNG